MNLIQKKQNKLLIKGSNHFGPGNHVHFVQSKKDSQGYKVDWGDDFDDSQGEEGLDEREPEKALCADKMLFNSFNQEQLSFNQIL